MFVFFSCTKTIGLVQEVSLIRFVIHKVADLNEKMHEF
jgi:hypothetical protein